MEKVQAIVFDEHLVEQNPGGCGRFCSLSANDEVASCARDYNSGPEIQLGAPEEVWLLFPAVEGCKY
ncbi:MAG: hypothetical protein NTW46_00500 [Candidatus Nealsonbacteria bacterium]|nr:hypothetical protein [Candidatus Nealsonbacteria bacterium]